MYPCDRQQEVALPKFSRPTYIPELELAGQRPLDTRSYSSQPFKTGLGIMLAAHGKRLNQFVSVSDLYAGQLEGATGVPPKNSIRTSSGGVPTPGGHPQNRIQGSE